jgi:hypothetical protein
MNANKRLRQEKALARLIDEDGYIKPGKELEVQSLERKGVTIEHKKNARTWLEREVESLFRNKMFEEAYDLAKLALGSEKQNEYVQKALYYKFTFG